MVGKIRSPQKVHVHILFPGICDYVGLHGKRKFKIADGIKIANELILKTEDLPPLSEWAQHNHKDYYK